MRLFLFWDTLLDIVQNREQRRENRDAFRSENDEISLFFKRNLSLFSALGSLLFKMSSSVYFTAILKNKKVTFVSTARFTNNCRITS